MFEGVALETPENVDTSVKDRIVESKPNPTSPEWNDYILSLFDEKELYDGRPLCAGLRRVAELELGRIIISRPTQIFPPTGGNGVTFSDVADSWEGNTDDTFCVFNTATAATRAEGRALRKALRLKTVAAEEMTKKNTASIVRSISQTKTMAVTEGEYNDSERMTGKQENFIGNIKCKQLNIDVVKFFKDVFDINVKRKVSKGQARDAIDKLNDYQQDKSLIPDSIKGFKSDWRN